MDSAAHSQVPERTKRAKEALRKCRLCPHNCGVDRTAGEKGQCGLDDSVYCFREVLHWGEEKGLNPSHQVYFAGCNLRCEFCTVVEWNEQPQAADKLDVERLADVISRRQRQGARTLNLLGGEPAVSVHGVLELLGRVKPATKVVWNSNMYYNDIVDELMAGLIDICLADLKCGNADCAARLLGSADCVQAAKRNILKAQRHSEVIVRHVLLPGHGECCLEPILDWLAAEAPKAKVSLRGDYVPPAQAQAAPMCYLRSEALVQAEHLAAERGLTLIR